MAEDTANKRIAKNSIFLSIRMVFVLAITLYTTRAVLGILGVEDYGIYNVVCGFVAMFTFLNTSMSNGIQRFFNFELGKNGVDGAKRVYNTAIFIQIILVLIIVTFAETFGLWYLNNKMVIPESREVAAHFIFQFSVLSFVFVIMQAPFTAAVMAHEKMDFYAVVSIIDAILKLVIVFIVPLVDADKLIIYGLLFALINLSDFVIYYIYCKKNFVEVNFVNLFDKNTFNSMLSFSGWNIFGALSSVMKEQGINLVMNLFFGPVVNAARGVATQVSSGLQSFVQNITVPVRPQVIQSYAQGNIDRTMHLTYSISKLSCCFLYLVSLPILVELQYVLKLWLGNNIPEHTNTFVYIIVITCFISNLNSAISGVVHASGIMRLYQIAGGLAGVLSVPAAYFTLKLGGSPESALWVSFASMLIAQINALLILKTIVKYSIKDYLKQVIAPFVGVLITTVFIPFIPQFFMQEGFARFCLVCFISMTSTLLSIYILALNKGEKNLVLQMVNKIKK